MHEIMDDRGGSVTSLNQNFIDMLYEAAEQPKLWPALFEEILLALEESEDTYPRQATSTPAFEHRLAALETDPVRMGSAQRAALSQIVLPHFKRAFRMSRRLAESSDQRDAALGVLERLPFGVVLVNAATDVLMTNAKANTIFNRTTVIFVRNGRLGLHCAKDLAALQRAISETALSGDCRGGDVAASTMISVKSTDGAGPISLFILPAKHFSPAVLLSQGSAGVLIYSPDTFQDVSEAFIGRLFELTPSEAKLTKLIVRGKSVEEAADTLGITYCTARSRLKTIYAKTNTHRQSELVHLVVTSPAILVNQGDHVISPFLTHEDIATVKASKCATREDIVILRDGRRIGYAEYGEPNGFPVFFFHSIIGCRLMGNTLGLRYGDASNCQGIRLICPERPGYGLSDPHPGRGLQDWADDVRQFADALGIDKFALLGFSMGGAYALACAYTLPDRVSKVGLVSTLGPTASIKAMRKMAPMSRAFFLMARYSPALVGFVVRRLVRGLLPRPEQFLDAYMELAPPSEQLLMRNPIMRQQIILDISEAFRNGSDGIHHDFVIAADPWRFDYRGVMPLVHIWHGDADHHMPLAIAEPLFDIPNCKVTIYPGEGHMLLFLHWNEIIALFAKTSQSPASNITTFPKFSGASPGSDAVVSSCGPQ